MATIHRWDDFELDPAARELRRKGSVVPLGGRALDVLVRLAATPGEIVTKDALARDVWGQAAVEDNTIAAQIAALRRALAPNKSIQTVAGRGYVFREAIQALPPVLDRPPPRRWAIYGSVLAVSAVLVAALLGRGILHPPRPAPWSEADDRGLVAMETPNVTPGDPALAAYGDAFAEALKGRFRPQLGPLRMIPLAGLRAGGVTIMAPYRLMLTVRRDGADADVSLRVAKRESDEALDVFNIREPLSAGADPIRQTILIASGRAKNAVLTAEQARSRAKPEALRDARDFAQLAMQAAPDRAAARANRALLERALVLAPNQAEVLDALASSLANDAANGRSADRTADAARAVALAQKALALHPDDLVAAHAEELAYMAEGRWADAVVAADRLLASAPEITSSKLDKALALAAMGRDAEAHDALAAALAVNLPDFENYRAIIAGLVRFREGDYAGSAEWFRRAVQTAPPGELARPGYGGLLLYLAASEARAGHLASAREAVGRFRTLAPAVSNFTAFESWDDHVMLPIVAPEALKSALGAAGF